MQALAYAPFGYWPVAIVSLIIFSQIIHEVLPRYAAGLGLIFGLGYFGVGLSWVYVSIQLFGQVMVPLAVIITFLFVLMLSLYIVLVAYLVRRLAVNRIDALLLLPVIWIGVEWLRGHLFSGFGWLQVGYAFTNSPLAAYAAWIGVLGIGLLVLLSASLAQVLFMRQVAWVWKALAVVLLLLIWLPGVLLTIPTQVHHVAQYQQVALIQGNIDQAIKWHPKQRQPTLDRYQQLTQSHWDKDIIVWPEMAIPAYQDQVRPYLADLHQAALRSASTLVIGLPIKETDGQRVYNGLIVLGGRQSHYLKRRLVPFGEYMPFKFLLEPIQRYLQIPMSDLSPGQAKQPVIAVGDYLAGVLICYEIIFGQDVRQAMPQAGYLINISNDAWFGGSLAPYQHLQIAQMRALESARYILRATNTGISAIIKPNGSLQAVLPQDQTGSLSGTIQIAKGSTPYSRYGDYPVLLVIGLIILIVGYRRCYGGLN